VSNASGVAGEQGSGDGGGSESLAMGGVWAAAESNKLRGKQNYRTGTAVKQDVGAS
jgi:hypothetical protein